MLLVDSEAPVSQEGWAHLANRDGWARPDGAQDDQTQLMVQCMETWCAADRNALRDFFGQDLHENALPSLHDLEKKAKDDVQAAMAKATRDCGRDRTYAKGKRSFELLGRLDPKELANLPHFVRLCKALKMRLA